MLALAEEVWKISQTDLRVLISGETGTGKEVVARLLMDQGPRKAQSKVLINVTTIPPELVESELFGHIKGSFTGAIRNRVGKFVEAHKGSLFFDEIGDMPLAMQAKLLRVLQFQEVVPVGGSEDRLKKVSVRIISATNKNLEVEVKNQRFREDLFYRLIGVNIHIPPLRDHPEDILPLAKILLDKHAAESNKTLPGFTREAAKALQNYPWPGNIRELDNMMEVLAALSANKKEIPAEKIIFKVWPDAEPKGLTLVELERAHILKTLRKNDGQREITARQLGIDPATLYRKLKRYERL
ncbi:MAG: Response regulatory protein [Bacteriovoracaceae bacterium]|nr:Response regulatory protein [Bacteriovoracaceae bacterium]